MKYERTRLFVDPLFQGRLLARLAIYWITYHFVLFHLIFLVSLFSELFGHVTTRSTKTFFEQYLDFAASHTSILVCSVVSLPIIVRDMLKFSHRIAGPLVRFREVIKQMVQGKTVPEPVKLRTYDLPTDFLAEFNKLVAVWNKRLAEHPAQTSNSSARELAEIS